MPEGEGYQPTEEDIKLGEEFLAQEHLESMEITESEIDEKTWDGKKITGIQHTDHYDRVVLRDEKYEDGQEQAIQYKYYKDGSVDEKGTQYGKKLEGVEAGKEMTREHPMTVENISVSWEGEQLDQMNASGPALLEVIAHTPKGGDGREPYLHLEITDPNFLDAFATTYVPPDKTCGTIDQVLARNVPFIVHGRTIIARTFHKASVDVDPVTRLPTKVTLHCRDWEEAPSQEQVSVE